jgi:cobalamin 5'-phosphate synthase/cobalamin synthase
MRSFLAAVAFLTIVPVRLREPFSREEVARSRYWYPVVGLLLGIFLGGLAALVARIGAPPLGAFLILAAWILLTGALHVDGFCDLCDGLFGGQTALDRLQIMKDPHVGTFGLVGTILLLLGKWVFLGETLARSGENGPWAVGTAVAVARCLALVIAGAGPYPRAEGTGKVVIEATTPWQAGLLTLVGCAASTALMFPAGLFAALMPFLASLVLVLALARFCLVRLGGITGDCLGAAIEATEFTFLLATVLIQVSV